MDNLYYIPIEKDENEFIQTIDLDRDEMADYHISVYKDIIEKHFIEKEAIVKLKTGKFRTKVYEPKEESLDVFFCLVNKNYYPDGEDEIELEEETIDELRESLISKVKYSEGIVSDQIIDIISNFVTPRIKFNNEISENYYHQSLFEKSCIVYGPPGCGKTTLLRKLTLDIANNSLDSDKKINKFPIYIQLREFNNYSSNFNTYINNCIVNTLSELKLNVKNEIGKTGRMILLLDGADEIDFEKFSSFKDSIRNFKERNPLISFIITSRPDRNYENISDFNQCKILPFNENQVRELTYRKLAKTGKWKEFISILNTVPQILDVLKNPLLLTLSHFLFRHKSLIPINTAQLIKELVITLVSNWDSQRNIERKFNNKSVNPIEILHALGKIALALSESKKDIISLSELQKVFNNFEDGDQLKTYLGYIEFSTGIIVSEDSENWKFVYKSIQDYFCSNYLVESVQQLGENIFIDKDWDNILKMISGLSSDPNFIINNILYKSKRSDLDKVRNTLSIFSESVLLNKNDIKDSFNFLEKFIIEYEKREGITTKNIQVKKQELLLKSFKEKRGLKELITVLFEIHKLKFTKYEYDFLGYLNSSNSKIIKSLAKLDTNKNKHLFFEIKDNNAILKMKEESPDIED